MAAVGSSGRAGVSPNDGMKWGRNLFAEANIVDITPIASFAFDMFSVGPSRTYSLYPRAKY